MSGKGTGIVYDCHLLLLSIISVGIACLITLLIVRASYRVEFYISKNYPNLDQTFFFRILVQAHLLSFIPLPKHIAVFKIVVRNKSFGSMGFAEIFFVFVLEHLHKPFNKSNASLNQS